jgi:hypothetical protein
LKKNNVEVLIQYYLTTKSFINLKTRFMKLNFASVALACVLPIAMYGQDSTAVAKTTAAQDSILMRIHLALPMYLLLLTNLKDLTTGLFLPEQVRLS